MMIIFLIAFGCDLKLLHICSDNKRCVPSIEPVAVLSQSLRVVEFCLLANCLVVFDIEEVNQILLTLHFNLNKSLNIVYHLHPPVYIRRPLSGIQTSNHGSAPNLRGLPQNESHPCKGTA